MTSTGHASASRNALALRSNDSDERFGLAVDALAQGRIVVLDETLALRCGAGAVHCEVIDPTPSAHRCANEYEVLVENARHMLESSRLNRLLPKLPKQWSVVDDRGSHPFVAWRPRLQTP